MEIKANYVLIGLVALVLLISIVQSLQINLLKGQITANAVKSSGIDMAGWTENEKMMYEHHGTLPARIQQNQNPSSNMVGGC